MKQSEAARIVGTTPESVRAWLKQAGELPAPTTETPAAPMEARGLYQPTPQPAVLSAAEEAVILELKREHPSMGPAQIRAQLRRFYGWRIGLKPIVRVLKANGYELVHRRGRPKGPEPMRFEAPRRNALWQADFAEMRVGGQRYYLLVLIDDFSRFCVGHVLADSAEADVAVAALQAAIARHGKPEAIRTDRGGAFTGKKFTAFCEAELIDHIRGRPYKPQGGGKVEALIGTIRRELWDIVEFVDKRAAQEQLEDFMHRYNESRAHMGIDGLTPADRFFGRADHVLEELGAIWRGRQAPQRPGAAIEERSPKLEVLRLAIVGDHLELTFCGCRVDLGRVQSPGN
ncbi:MAG: DDE-type integrase/transposase/recombinase [Opitutales bacterium]